MLVQAVVKQMHEAGLDSDFVVELRMLEAIMERWARQGRPEGAEALDAAQKHLAGALKAPASVPCTNRRGVSVKCTVLKEEV